MSENGRNVTNGTLAKHRADMERFLEKLRESGNIRLSCKAADINRRTVYRWRDRFSTFADEWNEALEDALDLLEGEAWKRAREGSDRLLMYLLTAHRPDKYGDRVKVDSSGELTVRVVYDNHGD